MAILHIAIKCKDCGKEFSASVPRGEEAPAYCADCVEGGFRSEVEAEVRSIRAMFEQLLTRVRVLLAERMELIKEADRWRSEKPIDKVLFCPVCLKQHLDVGEFRDRVHRKHKCENTPDGPNTGCGNLWVPHSYATRGIELGEAIIGLQEQERRWTGQLQEEEER